MRNKISTLIHITKQHYLKRQIKNSSNPKNVVRIFERFSGKQQKIKQAYETDILRLGDFFVNVDRSPADNAPEIDKC